jgi:hypothetical protein
MQYKCQEKKETTHLENRRQNHNSTKQTYSTMENDLFYEERPEMTTVYFEPRRHLNQHTQFLHRSGLITLRNGLTIPQMMGPIATVIANRVGWRP